LNGAPLLDFLIKPTVDLVFEKLASSQGVKLTATLKRHLVLTLLSCALQNPLQAVDAIVTRTASDPSQFFKELIEETPGVLSASCSHKKLRSPYEIKLYSVALTNIVFRALSEN